MCALIMYRVATISRLLKIIGLFCKRALYKSLYSGKETFNFKEPTNRSHPVVFVCILDRCVLLCDVARVCLFVTVCWGVLQCVAVNL